mmetsp:Transcript_20496/g.38675  ORF Transcript_20496/g.38675 Transcript_20496/m.38675 type:complete len:215 (+) Transcript_20496:455-1099(+)
MNSLRRRLPPSAMTLGMLIAAYLIIPPLQAFSTVKFSSRRVIGWRSTSSSPPSSPSTCNAVMFQDEDCEDLCDAFGVDDSLTETLSNNINTQEKKETTTTEREKSTISHDTSQKSISRPRRTTPKALWYSEEGMHECESCNGSGEQTCRFCGGTHFLSAMGGETDALFLEGIGKDCPVCNDDGVEVCNACAGTGVVFKWSPPSLSRNHTGSFHP